MSTQAPAASGIPGMPLAPSYRHAEPVIAAFDAEVAGLEVAGYDVSGALRLPFYSDCVRSARYREAARHCWLSRLAGLSLGWSIEAAPVLVVREGASEREREQTEGPIQWLTSRGCPASAVHASVRRTWGAARGERTALADLEPADARRVAETARRLQGRFGLGAEFAAWFEREVRRALGRYRSARECLQAALPTTRIVIVNSEYHPSSRAMACAARDLGLPTVLLQHGFLGEPWLHFPVVSTRVCIWGQVDHDWYRSRGVPESRLVVTGSWRARGIDAAQREKARMAAGIGPRERAVLFFAPNLDEAYHVRAARFLSLARLRLGEGWRWFVRPHPSQRGPAVQDAYASFASVSSTTDLYDALALADVILHDYSTMAFAEFAGLRTACLSLDPPCPRYFAELVGDQPVVSSLDELCAALEGVVPGAPPVSGPTRAMASGGDDALAAVGETVLSLAGLPWPEARLESGAASR